MNWEEILYRKQEIFIIDNHVQPDYILIHIGLRNNIMKYFYVRLQLCEINMDNKDGSISYMGIKIIFSQQLNENEIIPVASKLR